MLPIALRQSIRMAFEGRSSANGACPLWLEAASDIRFVGQGGTEDTLLYFGLPRSAKPPKLYDQQELWAARPHPENTGFDLLGEVICDVARRNADSEKFDKQLLKRICHFDHALNGTFEELTIGTQRIGCQKMPWLNCGVITSVKNYPVQRPALRPSGKWVGST